LIKITAKQREEDGVCSYYHETTHKGISSREFQASSGSVTNFKTLGFEIKEEY
jgi:hypothetical protein